MSNFHKKTDPPILLHINGFDIIFHGECEPDDNGVPVTYEIEMWEYPNFMRLEANLSRYTFTKKSKAERFVSEKLSQMLVTECDVYAIRHNTIPVSRKNIFHYEY